MPAALAIVLIHGGPAPSAPSATSTTAATTPVAGNAFGQVLQSVQGSVTDHGAGAIKDAKAEPVADPNAGSALMATDRAAALPVISTPSPTARTLALGTKPARAGKNDNQDAASRTIDPAPATSAPAAEVPVAGPGPLPAAITQVSPDGSAPARVTRPVGEVVSAVTPDAVPPPVAQPLSGPDTGPAAAGGAGGPTQGQPVTVPPPADNGATLALHVPNIPIEMPAPDGATTGSGHKNTPAALGSAAGQAPPRAGDISFSELMAPAITLTPVPATAAAPSHAAGAAAPMEQIAPALLTLAKTAGGNQQMTVRLQPENLGMVQVRIEVASSGATRVEITAEKSDTLQALQRDQPQLHHMLDEAGIPAAGRTVTFHVAQPAQAAAGSNGSGQGSGQQAPGSRMNGGSPDAGGSAGGGKGGYPARESNGWSGGRRQGGSTVTADAALVPTGQSYRIGLDITA